MLSAPKDFRWEHQLRALVLEQATVLEHLTDEVLSASLARSLEASELLQSEVFWRLPIGVRIEMLQDLLDRRDLRDRWPFVVPVLRSFFDLRHQLAHGLVTKTPSGKGIRTRTIKRGRPAVASFTVERLAWLAWQAEVAAIELNQVWAAVVSRSAVQGKD